MPSEDMAPKSTRLSAAERRALVLRAAMRAFARDGFAGTSTDAVAREAGVSQPYVVRIFGTKLDLFLEVFTTATDGVARAFGEVLEAGPFDPESDDDWERLGAAYTQLLADRDLLLVLMHGFTASSTPEIGSRARRSMGDIYVQILRTGCTPEQARDFVAQGMLLNVMVAIGAPEHADDGPLSDLARCAFGPGLELVTAGAHAAGAQAGSLG